ncbi:MAG: hypothetical protein JJU34_16365 [Lunatimonas sp.]|uniref:DUF637 domain-containing protein n=1 Tax=Lunatimonas sp. TaxID=2060141 RepID=UPI00263B7CA9|nr:DUF637 domain-containing protein [Lunatimonas sp.]MCC5938855.1 hypothetical protein [Lunatimonas sp.]
MMDPDGEIAFLAAIAIGAALGGAGYTASVGFSKGGFENWNWGQFGKSLAIGAVSGAATAGIGSAVGGFGGTAGSFGGKVLNEVGRAMLHGQANLMVGTAFGQSPSLSMYAAGAFGSLTGSALHNAGPFGQIGGSALAGGVASKMSGGDFWRGAAVGATVAGLNHLHTSYKRYLFERYDGIEHPGVLNLKNAGRNKVAVHLLKGIKHHMVNGTDIDLNGLFDCLSSECLGIGGTHLLSRVNQGAVNSFFGPSGDQFASFSIGDRNVKMLYEIPFHGSIKGLVFPHHNYQTKTFENGNWGIRWGGPSGLFLNFRNQTKFMSNWIFGR